MRNVKTFKTLLECLHDILDDYIEDLPYMENGNFIIIKLDEDRRIKVNLYNTFSVDNYDALKMKLISKTHGEIDTVIVKFREVFKNANDLSHPNKISKHIWRTGGVYKWYGLPDGEDYIALRMALRNYIDTWE